MFHDDEFEDKERDLEEDEDGLDELDTDETGHITRHPKWDDDEDDIDDSEIDSYFNSNSNEAEELEE